MKQPESNIFLNVKDVPALCGSVVTPEPVSTPTASTVVATSRIIDGTPAIGTTWTRTGFPGRTTFFVDGTKVENSRVNVTGHFLEPMQDQTSGTEGYELGYFLSKFKIVPPIAPVVKKKVNHVAIVVDKSGSMNYLCEAARKALNKTLDDLAVESRRTGISTYVSLFEFGDRVRPVYTNKFIAAVEPERTYLANMGMTALFDATGEAVQSLRSAPSVVDADEAYLLIAITDGNENQSRKFNKNSLNSLMREVQNTDRWTLTFLLPQGAKSDFCRSFGIPEGNVAEWELSERGVETANQATSAGVSSYFTARSVGATKSTAFYTTDASNITKTDLNKLNDISGKVKVWKVEKEVDIADFVQTKGFPYQRGTCFYQLTKDEKNIQDYKKLLIMEKGTKNVYAGDQARTLLGIPVGVSVKVKPGNHGNFDIFVQSTSLNRKLVRGTTLVYNPDSGI